MYGVDNTRLIDELQKAEREIAEAIFEWMALHLI
jgi:hypothetical protein